MFLLSVCPFSKPSTVRVGMLLFISQAMKADQACIVIFREKTAFRRYMICLFHVLDRLGSLKFKKKHCMHAMIDAAPGCKKSWGEGGGGGDSDKQAKNHPPKKLLQIQGGGGYPLTHTERRPQIFIPKRKSTSIVSSNWQHKFLYFNYKSVKLDVFCRENKI